MSLELSRTVRIDALFIHCPGLCDDRSSADRTDVRKHEIRCPGRSFLRHGPADLRNDLARLIDDDRIPDPDVKRIDKILIVERRPLDRRSAQADRVEHRCRIHPSGHADRDLDIPDDRLLLLGRILVGDMACAVF